MILKFLQIFRTNQIFLDCRKQILDKKNPNPSESGDFSHVTAWAYPEAFEQRGYGKKNKIKQMVFAFDWALSLLFSFQSTNMMPQSLQKANRKILLRITTVRQWTAHWQKWSNQSRQFLVKNYRDRAEACSKHWRTPESSCSPQTRAGKSFSTSYMKFCANPAKEWNI